MIYFNDLEQITGGKILSRGSNAAVTDLLTDSRRLIFPDGGIFFAKKGGRKDGHDYIQSLYDKGVRQFVVEQELDVKAFAGSNILQVRSSSTALQAIAAQHRKQFNPEVVAIAGSDNKSMVKRWLYELLLPYKHLVKSSFSYPVTGVPLSVWEINEQHEVGIFEAGKLQHVQEEEKIIKPDIGILAVTSSKRGLASSKNEVAEYSQLFKDSSRVIYCKDEDLDVPAMTKKGFTWGTDLNSDIIVIDMDQQQQQTAVTVDFEGRHRFIIPFPDAQAVANVMHCIAYMLLQGYKTAQIQDGISKLEREPIQLTLTKGINDCDLINDNFSHEAGRLKIALDFLTNQSQHQHKTVILSDIPGLPQAGVYRQVNKLLNAAGVSRLIAIGPELSKHKELFTVEALFYTATDEFLNDIKSEAFKNEGVLIKGTKSFGFDQIINKFEDKSHSTRLEVNLDAITHNLKFYSSRLAPETKVMVMVKAFGYGSGIVEVANLLQFHQVDYLGVAYVDEGTALRKNGITLPIMVMNPSEDSFDKLDKYQLETEVFNLSILKKLIHFLEGRPMNVHLKLDTGMHRLGFEEDDIQELTQLLSEHKNIKVKSIFSHLAGADDALHEAFTGEQAQEFDRLSHRIMKALDISPIRHLVNSPGILRYPEFHFDMVRLGIGLYGLETNEKEQHKLRTVGRLKTIISQVKDLKKGDTVGYGRKGMADSNMRIATIAAGYADGFSRAFSNNVGEVWLNGRRASVIGSVCMDMTMVDITGIDASEGDEVEIFGAHLPISELAAKINTIPYEILTGISQRVKRRYYSEEF